MKLKALHLEDFTRGINKNLTMTKVTKKLFKKAVLGTGGIMLSISKNLNCTRQTVYDFCRKNPDMELLRQGEMEKILDITENSLFNQAKNQEQWAVKYLLATKGKKRGYIEKQEIEHSSEKGITINLVEKSVEEIKDGKSDNKSKTEKHS